jgi:hypothetical protein
LIQSGTSCGIPGIVAEAWEECFDNFSELYQQSHTRFPGNIGQESTSSRLDRIYCNLPVEAFALLSITSFVQGNIPDNFISDHLPMGTSIEYKDKNGGDITLPHFMFGDKLYDKLVEDIAKSFEFSSCCWARLGEMKSIFRHAYTLFQDKNNIRGARLAKERIFWSLQCLRACDGENLADVKKAIKAAPQLGHQSFCGKLPLEQNHILHIRQVLQEALHISDREAEEEIKNASKEPEYRRCKIKDGLANRLSLHNPKRQRVGIEAVKTTEGVPLLEKDEANAYLGSFWGTKFQETGINIDKATRFAQQFFRKIPAVQ